MEKKDKIKAMATKYPGWRTMSSSARYNAKLHNIFNEAMKSKEVHDAGRANHVAKKHGDVSSYGSCKKCHSK